ncbi:MAG: pyridoxal phosphate-dependent aminotransferase [Verrucomicrobiales bacterium]|nr:pyridoxal phosphate-dependent aminotransferase [Verrucomicrobiales bacterium]
MPLTSGRARSVQAPIIPQVAEWIRTHPGTLSLGQGIAGYPPPPEALAETSRLQSEPQLHRYQSVEGLPELLEALRGKLARRNGMALGPDRSLLVTAGANAAFQQVILALCDPGDEVILPLPCYFNQDMALALASVRAVHVRGDRRLHPDVDALARAITSRTRAIVTVSPNNPTGAVYPGETLQSINTLCRERGLVHISDETYEDFTYGGITHVSPGGFPGASGHTVSLFSFSKAYGFASWRVGYVVYPSELRDAMRTIQDTFLICPPVVSQLAALGCLKAGDAWLRDRLSQVAGVRSRVLAHLESVPDLAQWPAADGAFYVHLRIPGGGDPMDLARRLIEQHRVAVIPGTAFGETDACTLRVAYGALTAETADDGLHRLIGGLKALRQASA